MLNLDEKFNKFDVYSVSGDNGVINQILFQGRSFAGKSVKKYHILNHYDVVYTKSPLKSNPYGIIKTNKNDSGIVSTLYAVYSPLDDLFSPFIEIYFDSKPKTNNYLRPLVNKGAKNDMKVKNDHVLSGNVVFPSKNEQIVVVHLFEGLDHLIAANQRQQKAMIRLRIMAYNADLILN